MTRIVLHVGRLVLNGFRREDRETFAESLRSELARQFASPQAARGLVARGSVARISVPVVRVPSATPATRTGTQVARGIAQGMKP